MSTQSNKPAYNGPGFASLLTLLFIGLKLGHVIDWSWWWVVSPMLIGFVVLFCVGFIVVAARDL